MLTHHSWGYHRQELPLHQWHLSSSHLRFCSTRHWKQFESPSKLWRWWTCLHRIPTPPTNWWSNVYNSREPKALHGPILCACFSRTQRKTVTLESLSRTLPVRKLLSILWKCPLYRVPFLIDFSLYFYKQQFLEMYITILAWVWLMIGRFR